MKQTMLGFFFPSLKDGSLRNMEIKIDTYREADRRGGPRRRFYLLVLLLKDV